MDFENAFLTDGKRQLKIKYNPKVSSFKRNVLETKVDTIGGAYPFIFRNGRVSYNEFPISGLISYLSDNENLFLTSDIYKKYPREEDENINRAVLLSNHYTEIILGGILKVLNYNYGRESNNTSEGTEATVTTCKKKRYI